MRAGQIMGLRWMDVDLDTHQARLRQMLQVVKRELIFKEPKTRARWRTVAIGLGVVALLRRQRAATDHNACAPKLPR